MSVAETVTRRTRQEQRPPRRVVLISGSDGLVALLRHLDGEGVRLTWVASLPEALDRDELGDADAVVVDLPGDGADATILRLRHHYRGELVILAERGYRGRQLPAGPGSTLLERPFSGQDLARALCPPAVSAGPVAVRDVQAAARRAPSWSWFEDRRVRSVGLTGRALGSVTQRWRAQRRTRVVGFSLVTLLAFAVAFALAARGPCGPGCDVLGTAVAPKPQPAMTSSESSAPSTTGRKRSTATTGPTARRAVGVTSGGRPVTTTVTTQPRVTTTTRKPSPGGGGAPVTTRPTTTAPTTTPTTQPTTTPTTQPTTT